MTDFCGMFCNDLKCVEGMQFGVKGAVESKKEENPKGFEGLCSTYG